VIVTQPLNVLFSYLSSRANVCWSSDFRAIGWVEDGAIQAVAGYNGFHGQCAQIHIAGEPGRRWMKRAHLYTAFHYPFVQVGLEWLIGVVPENNEDAMKMDLNLGFEEFSRIPDGTAPGEDMVLLRLHKSSPRVAKWLSLGERYGWESHASATA